MAEDAADHTVIGNKGDDVHAAAAPCAVCHQQWAQISFPHQPGSLPI